MVKDDKKIIPSKDNTVRSAFQRRPKTPALVVDVLGRPKSNTKPKSKSPPTTIIDRHTLQSLLLPSQYGGSLPNSRGGRSPPKRPISTAQHGGSSPKRAKSTSYGGSAPKSK